MLRRSEFDIFYAAYAKEVKLSPQEVAHWPHALATAWMDFAPWFLSDTLPQAKALRADIDYATSLLLIDLNSYSVAPRAAGAADAEELLTDI